MSRHSKPAGHDQNGRSFAFKALTVTGIAAAAVLIAAPAASAATPARTAHHRLGEYGDTINTLNNLTPFAITLASASTDGGSFSPAPTQHTVDTGYTTNWSVNPIEADDDFQVDYTFTTPAGTDTVHTALTGAGIYTAGTASCSVTGPDAGNWTCDADTSWLGNITFSLHGSAAQINLSQANKSAFAQALSTLCDGPNSANGTASCSFSPTTTTPTYAESRKGFLPTGANDVAGCFMDTSRNTYQYTGGGETSQTVSTDNSATETVSTGVFDLANASFALAHSWGKSFTHDTNYSDSYKIVANYGYIATPWWYPTIASATGNFTATLDGTTYNLTNVTINTSGVGGIDSNGHKWGDATPASPQQAMTQAEWNQNCGGDTPPSWLK